MPVSHATLTRADGPLVEQLNSGASCHEKLALREFQWVDSVALQAESPLRSGVCSVLLRGISRIIGRCAHLTNPQAV
jgi:hypothetical protein